jgi:squalene-hopene/tetraprenyl-beta-curcumene cyclase
MESREMAQQPLSAPPSTIMNRRQFLTHFMAVVLAAPLLAQAPAAVKRDPALKAKVEAGIEKGLAFLDKQQKPDGSWSTPDHPAITALAVTAHLKAGGKHAKEKAVREGLEFVRKNVRPDGGIYGKGMGNYNTSICLATFALAGDSKDAKVIDAARQFLTGGQVKNPAKSEQEGGWGYESTGRMGRPDLDNTVFALEALRLSQKQKAGGDELAWKNAIEFVSRCQNLPSTNKEAWASDDAENRGGFVYYPGESPAGENEIGGKKVPRSYGSMSYAGLLSLLHAEVKKDDARIVAALDWLQKHFDVGQNPGMGTQGLYYYYFIMAKALTAAGVDELTLTSGKKVNWRAELSSKLLALQRPDGSWANDNPKFMERDPVLVTCYTVIALSTLAEKL